MKRLMRTKHDAMLGGVCGGLGLYFDVDPVLVRLLFVLFTLAGGAGPLLYLILWIIMPLDSQVYPDSNRLNEVSHLILLAFWSNLPLATDV